MKISKNKRNGILIIVLVLGIATVSSVSLKIKNYDESVKKEGLSTKIPNAQATPISYKLEDNKNIYSKDKDDVKDIYITIIGNTKYTLNDLNTYKFKYLSNDTKEDEVLEKPKVEVRVNFDKQPTKSTELNANAILQPRSHSGSNAVQKSFEIKLFDKAGNWMGQNIINLNKHPGDYTRVRNKLTFELIKNIPNISSVRTQFCHLYIKDVASSSSAEFVDYGLFTHVEQVNNRYIKAHGLAEEGYLYKADNFEFFRYTDSIKNENEAGYDKVAFEKNLRIRGKEEHSRLISMLDDVNNYNININDVIKKHFDRDNYETWLAINILTGNYDTNSQNFLLFSPINMEKWWFIPWDFDGAFRTKTMVDELSKEPISNYWGVVLHKRFFKDPNNVKELGNKIEEVSKYFSEDKIQVLLKKYYNITQPILKSVPDIKYLTSLEKYEDEFKVIPKKIEENKKAFYNNIKKPMPIFLGEPEKKSDGYVFNWGESYDLEGNDINYDFKLSTDPEFKNIVAQKSGLKTNSLSGIKLNEGKYYWKVTIQDTNGNKQIAFDQYEENESKIFGVKEFTIKN